MVNLPRGREVSGLHGARSLFQGAILRLVRLYGLSVAPRFKIKSTCCAEHEEREMDPVDAVVIGAGVVG